MLQLLTIKPKQFDLLRRLPGRMRRLRANNGELVSDSLVVVAVVVVVAAAAVAYLVTSRCSGPVTTTSAKCCFSATKMTGLYGL